MDKIQKPMNRLFEYMSPYYMRLSLSTASSFINKVADLMPPLLVGWMVDTVSGSPPLWITNITGTNDLWVIALLIAILVMVVFAIESLFEWFFQYGFMTLAQQVQHDLRVDAYSHLQNRELSYFEEQRTGNLMAMLNDDVNQLERFLNGSFNEIVQLTTLFAFGAFVLFMISWELALIGFLPIPLIFWGSWYYKNLVSPKYKEVRESVGDLSNRLENNISGIAVIKSFTAEKFEQERVAEASEAYKKANFEAIKFSAIYVPLIRMFIALGFATTMGVAAYWIINGYAKITIGELTIFAMMIQRILWPVTRLGRVIDEYERGRASAKRIFGLMDTSSKIEDPKNPLELKQSRGDLSLNNVRFEYGNGIEIIKGMTHQFESGTTTGIAGTTGSGKTSLIKLLLRFYDPIEGEVLLDGKDIRHYQVNDLRKNIALVSQDIYLFQGSIAENIAYGLDDVPFDRIVEAARKAQLDDFVQSLPKSYDTLVGERGLKLSGGQKQRLSIARAILKDAPILILDEATSAVDTETEKEIQENLKKLTNGKTAIIVAHRLSTIRHADNIIVLKEGRVEEQGTHDNLLTQKGIYAHLWNVQIGELKVND